MEKEEASMKAMFAHLVNECLLKTGGGDLVQRLHRSSTSFTGGAHVVGACPSDEMHMKACEIKR